MGCAGGVARDGCWGVPALGCTGEGNLGGGHMGMDEGCALSEDTGGALHREGVGWGAVLWVGAVGVLGDGVGVLGGGRCCGSCVGCTTCRGVLRCAVGSLGGLRPLGAVSGLEWGSPASLSPPPQTPLTPSLAKGDGNVSITATKGGFQLPPPTLPAAIQPLPFRCPPPPTAPPLPWLHPLSIRPHSAVPLSIPGTEPL